MALPTKKRSTFFSPRDLFPAWLRAFSVVQARPTTSHPAAAAAAEPLDDELPAVPLLWKARARRFLWVVAALALAWRLVLLPIGHPWDITVGYNLFLDIARGHSPYETFRYLTHVAQSAGWGSAYEYYAYPPVPIYLYYPLAKLFLLLHPHASYFFPAEGSTAMPNLPWDFYLWYKLPMWIADFLIAALLARMSGTLRGWRAYLLNPYVLLVSAAWTFDAVMVLGLLAGVFWLQQGKGARAGLALAFGTMVKFFPIVVVPTCLLYLIKKKRPLREVAIFLGAYLAACAVFLGPYLQGLLTVLSFHAGRVGGGMTWEILWQHKQIWSLFLQAPDTLAQAVAAFGTPTLAIVLLLAYWVVFTRELSFNQMILLTLLAFYVGSKLLNEQYALMIFPFAFLEAQRVGGAWRWFYRLLWAVPLAFAIMRVPIDHFLWLLYHTVFGARADVIASTQLTGFEQTLLPWTLHKVDVLGMVVLGVGFFVLSVVAFCWPARPMRRARRWRLMVRAAPLSHADKNGAELSEPPREEAERLLEGATSPGAG